MKRKIIGILVSMLLVGATGIATADWDPEDGHKMHFPQEPNPNGWDVDFHDWMLGDDWKCSESGPVTDIHFWISWRGDEVKDLPWIKVHIFSNNPGPPSTPAQLLWSRVFTEDEFIIKGPFEGNQGWFHPPQMWYPDDHMFYYQINIVNIEEPWEQEEGVIYWLVISTPYYEPEALGWKTSIEQWNDVAVFGTPGDWYPIYDPSGLPLDLAFVITGKEPKPDLVCKGSLSWSGVSPGGTVTGTFQVGNNGDPGSLLNWQVVAWPSWGTWSFSPSSGTGLPQGSWTTVTATCVAPNQQSQTFTGTVGVCNTDDATDCCNISVSLTTPKNKALSTNPLLMQLLERLCQCFPMLNWLLNFQ